MTARRLARILPHARIWFSSTGGTLATLGRSTKHVIVAGRHKAFAFLLAALSMLASTYSLLRAHGLRLVTSGATRGDWPEAWNGLGIAISAIVFIFADRMFRPLLDARFEKGVLSDLRDRLFDRVQRLPIRYVKTRYAGDIGTLAIRDTETVTRAVSRLFTGLIQYPLVSLLTIAYLAFSVSLPLTILSASLSLTTFLGPLIFGKQVEALSRQTAKLKAGLAAFARDLFGGIEVAKAYGIAEWADGRFTELSGEEIRSRRQEMVASQKSSVIQVWGAKSLSLFVVLVVAAIMVFRGMLDPGGLAAFVLLNDQIFWPLRNASNMISHMQSAVGSVERVLEVMQEPGEEALFGAPGTLPRSEAAAPPHPRAPAIAFEDVTFGYDGKPVLARVTLDIPRGTVCGITGPSGSGKSTLFALLLRLYEPATGRVLIDGVDLKELQVTELRREFSIVTQEPYLFDVSIRDNLLWAKPDATEAELVAASRLARANDFIERLPHGLDTAVGQRGTRLSGGQRQRIAIARALLRNAPILLLDEATSSLDVETDREVHDALEELMKGRTTLVISHRIATIQNADCIVVLSDGTVVEKGTHSGLLSQTGLYRRLYYQQVLGVEA